MSRRSDPEKINMKRYEDLKIGEALANNHLYPYACNELSEMLNLDMCRSQLPTKIIELVFPDILLALRLLPDTNTSAISAANLLMKRVEAMYSKLEKKLAFPEFKKAEIGFKRRTKSPCLPQDILIRIFSLLDVLSLLSASLVSRSWNQAAYDDHLWRSQFDFYFSHKVSTITDDQSHTDWREAFKNACIATNSSNLLRPGRVHCIYCDSVVWHDKLRCSNKQCQLKSGNRTLEIMSTGQVVDYLYPDSDLDYSSDGDVS